MEKVRNIATVGIFILIIFGLCIAFFVTPQVSRSRAERRLLARHPQFSLATVLSGEYMYELDEYMQDQFPLRERFRTVNAVTRYVLGRRDNNGFYFVEGHLSQIEYPLNARAVHENAARFNALAEWLFEGHNVFYAIIPDKNYFLAERNGFPSLDYNEMMRIIHHRMGGHTYIDLFSILTIDDFYRTDIHWRQEAILPIAEQLARYMGVTLPLRNSVMQHALTGFRGSFYGHAALPIRTDDLIFLTNQYTENAIVRTLQEGIVDGMRQLVFSEYIVIDGERIHLGVYNPELFGGMDGYDVFLAGAQAIMTIEVPNAQTDRELIIFRDSFGSSIAPLLLGGYSKITLVDIRYISSHHLPQFIEITNQDVLFIYSTVLLNRANVFQ